ncbi:S-layer domain protein [Peptoclostridium acidaminophilum DSM 3953]|uniref:S-layer domain protein n=1 Tax=Peptoclostridium acidaminophilum DSM 3953 TaxID=1286171 RepID=W8T6G7_PEPAC|nr:S-layer homology domain-containing protein [Peptoclostridium acidaminophilum]AHM57344.1 S-layer domain protein [Peptoclostridium acidaminophilum DSM 3953]
MTKKFKAAVATGLALVMLPASSFAANFSDVKVSDWFYRGVQQLEVNGIVNGYTGGVFKPNNTITRAEFLKMVMASNGYKLESLIGEYWGKVWLERAYKDGLLDDFDKRFFSMSKVNEPITRREMAKLIANAVQLYSSDKNIYSYITDFDTIEMEYKEYVEKAFFSGVITGYPDNSFKPYNTLTRAEACTVVLRMMDKDERQYPTLSIYQKRLSETNNFIKSYENNFTFNKNTGTSFIYNTNTSDRPSLTTLARNDSFKYDFIIDVMTESLKQLNGYDYLIRYDVNMNSDAQYVLNEYLKLIMPTDYAKIIALGKQNYAAGLNSTKTVQLGGWTLQYANSLNGDSKVILKIYRR